MSEDEVVHVSTVLVLFFILIGIPFGPQVSDLLNDCKIKVNTIKLSFFSFNVFNRPSRNSSC